MEGRILGIKIDGEFSQCEIDCTLNIEQEQLPTSSMDAGWRESIGGYKGWSVDLSSRLTVGAMLGHTNKVIDRFINEEDAEFELYFGTRDGAQDANFYLKGRARLQNGSLNAPNNGSAMANFSFVGCGKLESWWDEYWRIINAMPAEADKPLVIDTSKW